MYTDLSLSRSSQASWTPVEAPAHIYGLVVVAKLAGFVDTGGGSGGDGGATHGALIGVYFDFDCGVAARVENLTAPDCYNL